MTSETETVDWMARNSEEDGNHVGVDLAYDTNTHIFNYNEQQVGPAMIIHKWMSWGHENVALEHADWSW